jgi:hypothetical protein
MDMNDRSDGFKMKCRDVRKEFLLLNSTPSAPRADNPAGSLSDGRTKSALEQHLALCLDCAREYRIFSLGRAVVGLSGTSEQIQPDKEWFASLKAKVARQADLARQRSGIEISFPLLVWITAKQLIPIMAAMVAIILGASLLWRNSPRQPELSAARASDRFVFNEVYEYPQPTTDDVIQTLVAVEDKQNGK